MVTKRLTGNSLYAVRRKHFARHPLCVHCLQDGKTTIAQELDHIIPLWAGGTNAASNYQSLCIQCHAIKTLEEQGKSAMTTPIKSWARKVKLPPEPDGWPAAGSKQAI